MKVVITLSPRDYDAVLFDLDGVLTRTASVHAAAWKKLFDGFLEQRATQAGEPFVPFDIDADYRRYVDGKPRYDGVAAFLESRGIELPLGAPEDGPDVQSVHALGNLKDRYFLEHLEQHGVEPYEAAIALVRTLRAQEIKTAVVSSSNNCAAVLEAAGIAQLFDARVDGTDITRLELKGKPAPDAFLEAARRLGAEPSRAVVVEDAIAGVEAGRAGRFGCVIGVDRSGQAQALREAGADVVVTDLAQVQVAAEPPSAWSLVFEGFDPAQEGIREALCTLGNGYFATRGAAAGAVADDIHYPGTYLAGGYNRLRTDIAGRVVENEDLVNFPNWLALEFRIAEQDWFDARTVKLLSYRQELDLRRGMLLRSISFEDGQGRRSTLKERRLVSMGRHAPGRAGTGADRRELVGRRHGAFGDRRARRQRGREAVSQVQQQAPGAAGGRGRWRGQRVPAGAHLPVEYSCRAGGANASVPRRTASRGPAPGHRGTGIHRAGTGDRPQARRDAGAGEAGLFLYLARSRHFGVRAGGAQGDCARGSLRCGDGGPCARLEAPVAPLRRAYPAGRSRVQAERPDAASVEHVSPAAGRVAQLHRTRYRRARAGLDRGGVSGPRLLG